MTTEKKGETWIGKARPEESQWKRLWEELIGVGQIPSDERNAFRKWYVARLGRKWWHGTVATTPSYRTDDPYYQEWVGLGRPSPEEWLTSEEKQRWTGLKGYEKAEELEGKILYTDEYSLEDLPELEEGFEWVEIKTDPTTRLPIRPVWQSQPIVTEKPAWEEAGFATEEERRITMGLEQPVWQREQWESEFALRERQLAQEKELSRQQSISQMQAAIQAQLAESVGPSDWIKRWELIHGIMPRSQLAAIQSNELALLQEAQELSGAERLMKEQQAVQLSGQSAKLQAQLAGMEPPPAFYKTTAMGTWTPEMLEEARKWEQAYREAQPRPSLPPAPSWLSQFAPGQVAGQPITKERIVTPSGQQWAATPWAIREGLRGYAEFAGYEPYQDILERMALMATETPYGAGRTQWRPARQRA